MPTAWRSCLELPCTDRRPSPASVSDRLILPEALLSTLCDIHHDAEAWLQGFPALLNRLQAHWQLRVTGLVAELSYNVVALAEGLDGTPYILKLSPPSEEFAREIAALRLYDGNGSCRLIRSDETLAAMLLERLTPGRSLWQTDDQAATIIAAELMPTLWRPVAEAYPLRTLASWTRDLPRYLHSYPEGGPLPHALVLKANALRESLLQTDEATLLHADLHHGNILSATRAPYLAIDPKGIVGPRGYEVGPFLANRLAQLGASALRARLKRRIAIFSEVLSLEAAELAAWGLLHCVLSACWSLEDHGGGHEEALVAAGLATLSPP